ncbi:uncharacterized protein LOC128548024 isoform X2 [Mercenaria mercenaria]|uniref:uncharacterized protein LOC128548024 isoform X2 n=1 Tax=Mercenaria mercenaria TaxID=6596 RepID=UPI00234E9B92|nr:uncharacterized protein LOC128548024 isoform X2 [Mercenaria mercenaria]
MADEYGDGFNPVDQGTVLMLCLSVGLAVLAALWFGCRWYKKKYKTVKPRIGRRRLKQTFSRFSQVDEELTMHHVTEHDAEILQRYSVHEPAETHSSPATNVRTATNEKKKPYLETDI